jgi:hypothetical protein
LGRPRVRRIGVLRTKISPNHKHRCFKLRKSLTQLLRRWLWTPPPQRPRGGALPLRGVLEAPKGRRSLPSALRHRSRRPLRGHRRISTTAGAATPSCRTKVYVIDDLDCCCCLVHYRRSHMLIYLANYFFVDRIMCRRNGGSTQDCGAKRRPSSRRCSRQRRTFGHHRRRRRGT